MSQGSKLHRLIQINAIGERAIELHAAKSAAYDAKWAYYESLAEYKDEHGAPAGPLHPGNPACAAIIDATKAEYKAYQAAKRKVYNAQRRLDNACGKLGEVA